MSTEPVRTGLLVLLHLVQQETRSIFATAHPGEFELAGSAEHWSPKDAIVQIAHWYAWHTGRLWDVLNGVVPRSSETYDLTVLHTQYQRETWDAVRAFVETAESSLVEAIESCGEAELQRAIPLTNGGQEPLWFETLRVGAWHPYMRFTALYRSRGQVAQALHMHQRAYDAIRAVPAPGRMRGGPIYNIACVYAQSGEPVKALNAYREAVGHDPELIDCAGEDEDMRFVRLLPGYDTVRRIAQAAGVREKR